DATSPFGPLLSPRLKHNLGRMDKQALNTASHAAFRLRYHVVFVVRYRHALLTKPMLDRLRRIFADVLAKWRCELIEFGGEADHIHLLIEAHPSLNLAQLIGNLKTVSARRMRQ